MKKCFCDHCEKEMSCGDVGSENVLVSGLKNGDFGAELFRVINIGDKEEPVDLYSASFSADLCKECQTEFNKLVMTFMNHES